MTQNLVPGAAIQMVGSVPTAAMAGASYAPVSGTITTAASTVTASSIGLAGNVTFYVYGTYAGVNVSFEISPDNTNWFPAAATREDNASSELTSGVLPANTARSWTMGAPGFSYVRVRATAWTSGTANVVIVAGTYPFEPMVSTSPPKTQYVLTASAAGSTTEALISFTPVRSLTAAGATTTPSVTAGKTFRIMAISVGVVTTAASAVHTQLILRAVASGTVTTTSPIIWRTRTTTNASAGSGWTYAVSFGPDGLELSSGASFGMTQIAAATTVINDISISGYEF